ncbi:MAG: hypothetical protein IT428_07520 [Planctomycetaceae bacterium]|nr:hypothetical protein [Planctomycetaceae bacterium]
MIAFEVKLNGKRICIAGAEDLLVLSTHITGVGMLGPKTAPERMHRPKTEVCLGITGMTARKDPAEDLHVHWTEMEPLKAGDSIEVTVLDVTEVDPPRSFHPVRPPSRRSRAKKAAVPRKTGRKKPGRKKSKG